MELSGTPDDQSIRHISTGSNCEVSTSDALQTSLSHSSNDANDDYQGPSTSRDSSDQPVYHHHYYYDQRQSHTHNYDFKGSIKPQVASGDLIVQHSNQEIIDEGNTTEIELEKALDKFKQLQAKDNCKENDVVILGSDQTSLPDDFPVVHPKLVEASDKAGNKTVDEQYNPSTEQCKNIQSKDEISFEKLINPTENSNLVILSGPPGSGKTTMSKRIVKASDYYCFLFKFMDMPDDSENKLTLRQFLLDKKYPELSEGECELIFKWICEHDDRCFFVLDGYDQSEWQINKQTNISLSYKDPQSIKDLISNLCHKHYLSRAHILVTSRPHSLVVLLQSVKSSYTILLLDLSFEDMKKLFFAFGSDNSAEELWDQLHSRAPQLVSACLNPLILQLIVKAFLNRSATVEENKTLTGVFEILLADFRSCHHAREDIHKILKQLSELAYNATLKSTVVINKKDLEDVGLSIEIAQDLIIATFMHRRGINFCKVFDGDIRLYFCHQTFQEHFTARYISLLMPDHKFKDFVNRKLFKPQWIVIRRFLFGILLDLKLKPDNPSEEPPNAERNQSGIISGMLSWLSLRPRLPVSRAELLSKALVRKLRSCSDPSDFIDLCHDVRECGDEYILLQAADCFPGIHLTDRYMSPSDAHALAYVVKKVKKKINLIFTICCLKPESFRYISKAVLVMPGSVDNLYISGNELTVDCLPDIISVFHKVNLRVEMRNCFKTESGWRAPNESEKKKIQEELNKLPPTSKLVIDIGVGNEIKRTR